MNQWQQAQKQEGEPVKTRDAPFSLSQSGSPVYIWQVALVGNGIDKMSILQPFNVNRPFEDTNMVIGVQYYTCGIDRQGRKISIVFAELGEQERFRFIRGTYVKPAHGGIVLFDMSSLASLESTREWIDLIQKNVPSIPIVLVGINLDKVREEELEGIFESANAIVEEYGLAAFFRHP